MSTTTPLQNKLYKKELENDPQVRILNDSDEIFVSPLGSSADPGEYVVIGLTEWNSIPGATRTQFELVLDTDYGAVVQEGLVVSDGGTTNDLNLAITAGRIKLADGTITDKAAVTVAIAAAPGAGLKRIDTVVYRISDGDIVTSAGTSIANASVAVPGAVANGHVALAEVLVDSSVTGIADAKITDVRPRG